MTMHTVLALLVGLAAPGQVPAEFVTLFTPLEYRYSGGGYEERLFKYRLYVPDATTERMPLVVWLHGVGEAGHDNVNQLRWLERLVFRRSWKERDYPFFLLAVQCPLDNSAWTRNGARAAGDDDMIDVARAVMEETLRSYPIDPERVYLAGISSGGSGCWEFAARYPEYFAAVAPMASGGGDRSRVELPSIRAHPLSRRSADMSDALPRLARARPKPGISWSCPPFSEILENDSPL
jgi:poly(3-hydroxybutyrate) depolymerase